MSIKVIAAMIPARCKAEDIMGFDETHDPGGMFHYETSKGRIFRLKGRREFEPGEPTKSVTITIEVEDV